MKPDTLQAIINAIAGRDPRDTPADPGKPMWVELNPGLFWARAILPLALFAVFVFLF